jgi:small-conductance mechanosensitive channel
MESRLTYLLIITGIALILLFWLHFGLRHIERRRARRIEKLAQFDAIDTDAPVKGNSTGQSRKKALEGLETRFSIVRRTFLSMVLLVWLIAFIVPFVGKVPGTLISLSITAGAVIVGIAARPMVENFIAGFVLTFSKQFHTGDTIIIDKEYGTIEDITPTHTVIKLWDWRRYIVPNSGMLSKEVINFSTRDSFLWAKLEFFVAHDANLEEVESVAVGLARESPYHVGHEEPRLWVMGMEKEAIKCWLAMWAGNPADAWSIRTEVGRALTIELNKRGIKTHAYLHSPIA